MALGWKARTAFGTLRVLSALRLVPSAERAARWPVEKRTAFGPPKWMTGPAIEVPTRDEKIATRDGGSIRVRVYQPAGATVPLLYAHGGGFVMGGVAACDHVCRRLAVEANVVVASVEYRLAPEHQFPGPLQDCEDALDWLLQQGFDNAALKAAGDSAGGNLAAALALRMRDRGTSLAGQLLIYPALDLTLSGEGMQGYRGVGLTTAECRLSAQLYLGDADPKDPYASPLLAPDLSGLAPALVVTTAHDPLHDEGGAYVAGLLEAGVPARLIDLADHAHGSLSLPGFYSGVDELYAEMTAFLHDTRPRP